MVSWKAIVLASIWPGGICHFPETIDPCRASQHLRPSVRLRTPIPEAVTGNIEWKRTYKVINPEQAVACGY